MEEEALPNQATIFPIQMNNWADDKMLAVDDLNCQLRKTSHDNNAETND